MYQKVAILAIVLLYALDASTRLTNAYTLEFEIDKILEDGVELNEDEKTQVGIVYDCTANNTQIQIFQVTVTRSQKFGHEDIQLYFANEAKNILQVTLTTKGFSGMSYALPYDPSPIRLGDGGDGFQQIGATSFLWIDKSWFPLKTNKISAWLQRGNVIYNSYGLKNFPISLPDTMVVDNFVKLPCHQV